MSLAAIFALRMLGLFLILPVFAVHAAGIPGGDNLTLVGLAIGAYGLTQACLQIAYGAASDRFGRKPVLIAMTLAVLMFTGWLEIWHIIVLSLCMGIINAVDVPARQSFIVQMIDHREDLTRHQVEIAIVQRRHLAIALDQTACLQQRLC